VTYTDRRAAGEILAKRLSAYADPSAGAVDDSSQVTPGRSSPPTARGRFAKAPTGSPQVAPSGQSATAADSHQVTPSAQSATAADSHQVAPGGQSATAAGSHQVAPSSQSATAAGSHQVTPSGRSAIVLGLVRGGVPVASAIATALGLPLDALVVRKLGVPWAPEVAFGALGPAGVQVLNEQVSSRLSPAEIASVIQQESAELVRREHIFRSGRPPLDLTGHDALVIDDGLATGATARAAIEVVRRLGAARVVLAVPVGSAQAVEHLNMVADEVVCPWVPRHFDAVSRFYKSFPQVSDGEVVALLSDRHVDKPR
jgi:predicted phosphoribosyltransferase